MQVLWTHSDIFVLYVIDNNKSRSTIFCDSARHQSQEIYPPISQIVPKNIVKISLNIKECPEEKKN